MLKSKLILIKYKSLFLFLNLEIYEDKNIWSSFNMNTNFYKEIEVLFSIFNLFTNRLKILHKIGKTYLMNLPNPTNYNIKL